MSTAVFTFKATDATGVPQKGEMPGLSREAVQDELAARGWTVSDLQQKKNALQVELSIPKRIKATDLTIVTRQLATMVSSGMTLLRAFYVLEEQVEHPKLKEILSQVREGIESG